MNHYVIVGSGLFGSICAYEIAKRGHKVTVLEKRAHIGGNIYTKMMEGINVHQYGAHIFHTSDQKIWTYMNRFADFHPFINAPIALSRGKVYNLPFNMNTFAQLWGISTPDEAYRIIEKQKMVLKGKRPENLEEQAIALVGEDVYRLLIKEYTEKQWGESCKNLPSFIINRLPVRFTYDNNYFDDVFQGIPVGGYTPVIEKMLSHPNIQVLLNKDFLEKREEWLALGDRVIYTGMIDEYYNYCFGSLDYRSLRFEHVGYEKENYQGNAVVNYIDRSVPFTRMIEHKHFEFGKQKMTVVTKEYPVLWKQGLEPYYPINNSENNSLYKKYRELSSLEPNVIFGGRLGSYRYMDMDDTMKLALQLISREFPE